MEIMLTLQYTPSTVQMQLGDIVDVFKESLPRLVGSFVSQVVSAASEALVKGCGEERFRFRASGALIVADMALRSNRMATAAR